jgi:hypothetical protein
MSFVFPLAMQETLSHFYRQTGMDAESYLRKYMRPVPGGAIAWRRNLFSESNPFDPRELIDTAVDIAWDTLGGIGVHEGPALEIRKSGSYLVFSLNADTAEDILRKAA